jgi:SAM-dependent methyltransferase
VACPCCRSDCVSTIESGAWYQCAACQHRWRTHAALGQAHYVQQQNRNLPGNPYLTRKTEERVQALLKRIKANARILEVGCAEGQLGHAVKQALPVTYDGVELSKDHETAATRLDRVYRTTAAELDGTESYDLILAFHVLEHIEHVEEELRQWLRLLRPRGMLLIEVPHRSGHPDLACDAHPEHLHQFSLASLVALLARLGFDIQEATTGHFESPVYFDSLRVLAQRPQSDEEKRAALIARFERTTQGPFWVYGVGGDFRNYVLPIASELKILGLLDSKPESVNAPLGFQVERFDATRHGKNPILISSLRFKDEIARDLMAQGLPSKLIVGLDDVFCAP